MTEINQKQNWELEFKLIQQTPMIHFQHDHQGATLRASEVKPKLDKFLIKRLGGFDEVFKTHPDWFVGYFKDAEISDIKPALNYKMRFYCEHSEVSEPPKYGLYYGNMGARSEKEKAFFSNGNCTMSILCFNSELIDFIKRNVRKFFLVTNFGRMQDKGFGSFVVEGEYRIEDICESLAQEFDSKNVYYFECACMGDVFKENIFKSIKTLYSVMKSGYNINGKYHRSFLFEYFHKKNIGNEKAYMKKEKISPWKDGKPVEYPGSDREYSDIEADEYLYVRALLGVGDHIDYITDFRWDSVKNRYFPAGDKLSVSIKHNAVERYSSPVFFNVVNDVVYFAGGRVNKNILDKEFAFENSRGESVKLKTPSEFDIDDFLEFFFANYDPFAKGYGIGKKLRKYQGGAK